MRKNIIFITLLCITLSAIYAKGDISGVYLAKSSIKKLILKEDGSYLLINRRELGHCNSIDTLSFGKWTQKKGFLILNVDSSILRERVTMNVKESVSNSDDSLRIKISNPMEKVFEKVMKNNGNDKRLRDVEYSIMIGYTDDFYSYDNANDNYCIVKKHTGKQLYDIWISALPKAFNFCDQLTVNSAFAGSYQVKDKSANFFEISIPNLKLEFFTYIRYNNEYFPINGKKIVIRGEEFFKE